MRGPKGIFADFGDSGYAAPMIRFSSSGLRPLAFRAALILLLVFPLTVGGYWIYQASAAAFALQHTIRDAQNLRGNMVRILLLKEADVRGFAATMTPFYADDYRKHSSMFNDNEKLLLKDLRRIDPHYDAKPLLAEMAMFHAWESGIAGPILAREPGAVKSLLKKADPRFFERFLSEDAKIEAFLDDAVSLSESHRQTVLRRILIATVALVLAATSAVVYFLWLHQQTDRRRTLQSLQLREERRLTDKLQRSLVPDRLPEIAGVQMQALYIPAAFENLVGGDWYDVIALPHGRILCIIGDVAGHGLDAAALMNRARHSLMMAALGEHDPAAILLETNRRIAEAQAHMVTAFCGVIDVPNKQFSYATAGHPPPVLVSAGTAARSLPCGGPPLGIFEEIEISTHALPLMAGDSLFFFTDGLLENEHDVIAGEEFILTCAVSAAEAAEPASALYHGILQNREPRDDCAVVAIRLT